MTTTRTQPKRSPLPVPTTNPLLAARKVRPVVPDMTVPTDPTMRAIYKQAHRTDTGNAFLPDPEGGGRIRADDAESFAEEFIVTATTGEGVELDALDEVVDEEDGGPFLEVESEADLQDALGLEALSLPRAEADAPAPRRRRLVRRA